MTSTRLSGNEIYCLAQKGYRAGKIVLGSSVYSAGALQSLSAGIRMTAGKELRLASQAAAEIRRKIYQDLQNETGATAGASLCGLSCNLVSYPGYLEYTSTGSLIYPEDPTRTAFSSTANGQELYALLDAGYQPLSFVFGNVVYASGLNQGLRAGFKAFAQGEIGELSQAFTQTRKLALERLVKEAKEKKAPAVLGIHTAILPFGQHCEWLLVGSACTHPQLANLPAGEVLTSNLSASELWNLAQLGYAPQRLLFATTIYSLGLVGSTVSTLKSFFRGEITGLTQLLQEARRKCLAQLNQEAQALGADELIGVKIYPCSLGNGLLEFFALGTTVKKMTPAKTQKEQLPLQAFVPPENPFYNAVGDVKKGSPFTALIQILVFLGLLIFFVWLRFKN